MNRQLDIFSLMSEKYKINTDKVLLIELFAGIGAQHKALKYLLGDKMVSHKIVEWAYNSIITYNDIHIKDYTDYSKDYTMDELVEKIKGISVDYNKPLTVDQIKRKGEKWVRTAYNNIIATHDLIDISNVKGKDLDFNDNTNQTIIMSYSFPCFTADTLVLTENGYKKFIDLKIGEKVLTHTNKYRPITNFYNNGNHNTIKIKAPMFDELILTENHKLYTQNGWKEAKDLTTKDMLGIAINQRHRLPKYKGIDFSWKDGRKDRHSQKINMRNKNFWWVIGRYLGDGWRRFNTGIIICCAKNELTEITNKLDGLFHYNIVEEKSTYKVHISCKELGLYVDQFGKGAGNKHLTKDIFDLPIKYLRSFIDGYFSADGCIIKKEKYTIQQCCSISKQLIYDMGQCIAKAYKKGFSIYKVETKPTTIIDGRTVNQNNWFMLRFRRKGKTKSFYDKKNKIIWSPITKIENNKIEQVYDIEVEEYHSFVANSIIAHNCQDLSNAGKREGIKVGTRSGLLYEVERILDERERESLPLPNILLMENVPDLIYAKNVKDFNKWEEKLQQLGYSNYFQILNAKDYGIPQNRKRVFMISILGNYYYEFPKKFKLKYKLKDMLEDNVDEKYYLSDKQISDIQNWKAQEKPLENMEKVDKTNTSPTPTTRSGAYAAGMVLIKNATKKGYEEATIGDGIDISGRMEKHRGTVQKNSIQTLTTKNDRGVVVNGNKKI